MKAFDLCEQLEQDFIFSYLHDEFASYIPDMLPDMTENFKRRSMGLVCDFADEILQVFTAVFPSNLVLERIFADHPNGAMLFLHHPAVWDCREMPERLQGVPSWRSERWFQMEDKWVQACKAHHVSIYAIHVPLDNYSAYSTSKTLADALGLEIVEPFAPYRGGLAGVIGKTKCVTASELQKIFASAVGHETKLYPYGDDIIRDGLVAVVAGGGNDFDIVQEVHEKKINTLVTGVSLVSEYSEKAHAFERENRINVMGGTHYSTEKFACWSMCVYFRKLGLPARFVEDLPVMEDL